MQIKSRKTNKATNLIGDAKVNGKAGTEVKMLLKELKMS